MPPFSVMVLVVLTVCTIAAGGESVYFWLVGNHPAAILSAGFTLLGIAGGAVFWRSDRGEL